MYIIVCYDISDHRRRARLHEELLGFGTPVQRSIFECKLTPKQFRLMQRHTRGYARTASDSIRYYVLCRRCQGKTAATGTPLTQEVDGGPDLSVV